MNTIKRYFILTCTALGCIIALESCKDKEEIIFDHPFVYITDENGGSSSEIGKDAITVSTYWVYMSTKRLSENELVEYEVIAGDGLTAGTDFYLVPNTASPLVFLPGVYEMPIRIEWRKSTDFDPNKDNTVRIVLTGTSSNFTLGYPGPAQRNKEYVITKK